MKQEEYRLGIDIGGTKVSLGVVREDGTALCSRSIPSQITRGAEALVYAICDEAEDCLAQNGLTLADIRHIGAGIPGTADPVNGVARYTPNLFERNVPLAALFAKRWNRPVTVVQDSWAAAWAEYLFGQKKKHENMLCVTIGTGIGCGVILGGKVLGGAMRTAGEIGHTAIVPGGRPCACGRRGCLETYASGTAILAQALERFPKKLEGRPQRTESVFALAYEGDADALSLIADCVDKLAYGLAMMVNILSVPVITVSGGVCVHEKLMIEPLANQIRAYGYPAWAGDHQPLVLKARLGSLAPMIGAAFLTNEHIY